MTRQVAARTGEVSARVQALHERARAGCAFLGEPLWWLAASAGLFVTAMFVLLLPQGLAGSALRGTGAWLSCVLWQPVLEEVTFRGIVQGELLRSRWGARGVWGLSVANLLSSLAFTAIHFVHHPPLWAASVFVPSLLFGFLRERYRGLGAPIGLHVVFNLQFFAAATLVSI